VSALLISELQQLAGPVHPKHTPSGHWMGIRLIKSLNKGRKKELYLGVQYIYNKLKY